MNYEIILILLGIACGLSIIMNEEWYDKLLVKLKINFKPFVCVKCLTFWLSILFLTIKGIPIVITISAAFINAFIAELIYRKLMNMI